MTIARWPLIALTILTPSPVPLSAQDSLLNIQPQAPRQGEVVFVRFQAPAAASPRVTWRKRELPMYPSGGAWTAALPVAADTPPGGHGVSVRFEQDGETKTVSRTVEVAKVTFPIQRLRMSRAKSSLYTYPGVKKEDATIRAAAHTVSETSSWKGDWALPAKGRFSTPFGVRRLRNGKEVGRHSGLDIAAPTGTPIVAPAAGTVALAGGFKKHGNTVVLDHGQGVTSIFIHLSKIEVKTGQKVARGARLGRVGSTGASTGPHLHWSVYTQGTNVDPRFYLRLSKRGVNR
ncbi:MAG: M23 family metallopeptidase [Actinomycetota bacterium]